jgi:hypothetical protein
MGFVPGVRPTIRKLGTSTALLPFRQLAIRHPIFIISPVVPMLIFRHAETIECSEAARCVKELFAGDEALSFVQRKTSRDQPIGTELRFLA